MTAPVITIDGPSGVGKGTVSQRLAQYLNWHFLDSGVLYRVVAWAVLHHRTDYADLQALEHILNHIRIEMHAGEIDIPMQIYCDGHNVSDEIRSEECSKMASTLSAIPLVRSSLLDRQRAMRTLPGLVTDGRDMGTVVFPDAELKFFFSADPEIRAKRRYNQLKAKGISVSLREVEKELAIRDHRDQNREIAPLKPAADVVFLDTTHLSVDAVFERVLEKVQVVFGAL